jgi:iron complex transport system permease protein
LTLNIGGYWDFLHCSGKKLLALMVVGYAIGVDTLFSKYAHNPILLSFLIQAFDSLYIITSLVFF